MTEEKMKNSWAADRIIVLACLFLLVLSLQFTQYGDYDLWWHMALGKSIYDTGEIYDADEFSYTFTGTHQFSSEWLSDLVIFLSYRAGGMLGVNILKALVLVFTLFLLFLAIRNRTGDDAPGFFAAVLTLTVVLFAIRFRLFIRPYIFSYLFIVIFIYVLSSFERHGRYKVLFILPAIQVFWSNMYSASAFGPMIFGFFMAGRFLGKGGRKEMPKLSTVFMLIIAASLISPEFYKPYSFLLGFATESSISLQGEFQPLSTQILWGYGIRYTFAYQALVLGSLIYFIFLGGWKNLYLVLLSAVFLAQSILHVRMIDLFSLVAAISFCISLERLLRRFAGPISRKAVMTPIMSAIMLILIPVSIIGSKTYVFGTGIQEDTFPEDALAFLDKEKISGTMFNSYPFGGYIMWRSPHRKTFIDGRHSHMYPYDFFTDYLEMLKDANAWKSADEKWAFDYALLEYDMRSRLYPLHLNDNPDWALVYWDNISTVYLKRTEPYLKIIEQYEYKVTQPVFYDFGYIEMYTHSSKPDLNMLQQIEREIALNPSNQEPRIAKVFVLHSMGPAYFGEALRELEISKELRPDLAMEHSAAAYLLFNVGEREKARSETELALAIDSGDPMGNEMKKLLGMD